MMSLQTCRLVALVTSKNKSQVLFLILNTKREIAKSGPQDGNRKVLREVGSPRPTLPPSQERCGLMGGTHGASRAGDVFGAPAAPLSGTLPTFVFSLLVMGGNEITSPSVSTRHG